MTFEPSNIENYMDWYQIELVNMTTTEKHQKQVMLAHLNLSEAEDLAATNNLDDITMAYEKLGEIIKRLEQSKDKTVQYLMENDRSGNIESVGR